MGLRRIRRGTTLAELLVALIFVAVCAGVVLDSVGATQTRSVTSRRRTLILAQAQSEIERTRSTAKGNSLTTGTTNTSVVIAGFAGSATQSKTIALVSGYTNLYRVTVSIGWIERTVKGSRSDSLTLETYMRAPDA